MSLLLRALVYVLTLFLVSIVYTGQRHATARDILRASAPMTGRLVLWSVVGVGIMFALEAVFIDW